MQPEPIDKAVILARGRGTRMRQADGAVPLDERQAAAAERGHKAMIPIGGRPFLDYVLTALADSGYRRICLVVGPEQEAMRDYYTHVAPPQRLRIEFALQPEAKGTADAVAAAESFVGRESFLMLNSDNYYPPEAFELMRVQSGSAVPLFERDALVAGGNIPAERVAKYAIGDIDERGRLRRIIEKPDAQTLATLPPPLWVSMNVWRFTPVILDACRSIQPSVRGEYELVSAVQYAIDQFGEAFHVVRMRAGVLDLTSRGDIVPVAARLAGREVQL
jgi:glucose-1-phosphate thymidylyltransferase